METSTTGSRGFRGQRRWSVLALGVISCVAVPMMHAAAAGDAAASTTNAVSQSKTVDFSLASPIEHMSFSSSNSGISSSNGDADTTDAVADAAVPDAPQPPARRRVYGRPRYTDKWHNADGSTKIAFEVGGGFDSPVGITSKYQTIGYKFSVGGGLNFNKAFGVLVQYDYENMGVPSWVLNNMATAYENAGASSSDLEGLDASTHLWSFTVNPMINFQGSGKAGAYIIGGIGYYHKTTNFTLPAVSYYCDYYYGCYPYQSNQTFDSYSSGAFGVNGGVGVTWKLSQFGQSRLFAEARYTWVDNDKNNSLFYTPNSYRTSYFPVTVGIRW